MKNFYKDGAYLENNPAWHVKDSLWKSQQIEKIIINNSIKPNKLCDVGCGAGEILKCMQENSSDIEYFGYEISPQAFEICNRKSNNKLTFMLKDILEENDVYFDVVMAIDVFEHIENYFYFLRKLKSKGDYFIFHIPLDLSVQSVLRSYPIIKLRKSVGHIHYFTKDTALETLNDTGYEVVDFFYTASSLELPDRSWKPRLMSIPRKFAFSWNKDLAVRILGGYSLLVLAK